MINTNCNLGLIVPKVKLYIAGLLYFLAIHTNAQVQTSEFTPSLKWSGYSNIWSGYAQRDSLDSYYGLNVRHLRLKVHGKLAPKVKYNVQFAFDKGNPALLDVYLNYEPYTYLKIRFGQFGVPGAKTGALSSPLWSTTKMVLNDRSTITQNWTSNTGLKGYRAGGLMLYGKFLNQKMQYFVMGAFPNTGPNYYWNSSVKNPSIDDNENRRALFTRLEYLPTKQIELGVHYNIGKSSGDTTKTNRTSYSSYFLLKKEKLRIMAEYIIGKNDSYINNVSYKEFNYSGYNLELSYKLKYIEPALRFDSYQPNSNKPDGFGYIKYDNLTLGLNYYPWKNIALMTNYIIRSETSANKEYSIQNNIFFVQLRFLFKTT